MLAGSLEGTGRGGRAPWLAHRMLDLGQVSEERALSVWTSCRLCVCVLCVCCVQDSLHWTGFRGGLGGGGGGG